jgi:hypothetical protein
METPDTTSDPAPQRPEAAAPGDTIDVAALVDELRSRAEERRRSGAYPPGLEHDLDVHFRHIVEHRPVRDLDSLHKAMTDFESRLTFDTAMIPTGSRVPGGEALHRSVSKLITRQTGWLAEQLQDFAESVRVILWKMVQTLDNPTHVHAELTAELDAVLDRLAYYERAPADAAMLGSILRRLEALETAEAARGTDGGAGTGPSGGGLLGRDPLAQRLAGCDPVLLLDLPEASAALAATEAGSLGGVALVGSLQSLSDTELTELVAAAGAALRSGGLLVLDSEGPAHPAHLVFSCRAAGFADVTVVWRPPPPAPGTHCTLTAVR